MGLNEMVCPGAAVEGPDGHLHGCGGARSNRESRGHLSAGAGGGGGDAVIIHGSSAQADARLRNGSQLGEHPREALRPRPVFREVKGGPAARGGHTTRQAQQARAKGLGGHGRSISAEADAAEVATEVVGDDVEDRPGGIARCAATCSPPRPEHASSTSSPPTGRSSWTSSSRRSPLPMRSRRV